MDVTNRALILWPNIIKVAQHWDSQRKSKRPNNKSDKPLVKCQTEVKLQPFIDIASQLKGFSEAFQTDKPMLPFLKASLIDVFLTLMKMIIKAEVFHEICGDSVSMFKLAHHELVKLSIATKDLLKSLVLRVDKKCQFVKECKANLVTLIKKLQKKCPLNFPFAKILYHFMPNLVAWLASCTN